MKQFAPTAWTLATANAAFTALADELRPTRPVHVARCERDWQRFVVDAQAYAVAHGLDPITLRNRGAK